jgi:hypothetical protein
MSGALCGRRLGLAVTVAAVFLALALGWVVAVSTLGTLVLMALIVLGAIYLATPADWIPCLSLVVVTLCAVLVPVNAVEGLFTLGPLYEFNLLALVSILLTGLTIIKNGLGPLLQGRRITVLVVVFLLVFIVVSLASRPTELQSYFGVWSIWGSAFILALYVPRRLVPMVISAWIALAFFEAAYALYEHLVIPPPLFEGYLIEYYGSAVGIAPTSAGGLTRARATFGHPIPLASFLAVACALSLFAVRFPSANLGLLRLVVVTVLAAGTVVTFARSSFFTIIVALCVGLLSPQISNWTRFRVLLFLTIGALIFLSSPLGNIVLDYVLNSENTASFQQRAASLLSVPAILGTGLRPALFGIGAGTQEDLYEASDLRSVGDLQVVDNQYITLLITTGLFGLGIFLGLVWAALSFAWRIGRGSPHKPDSRKVWGLGVALLTVLIAVFFYEGLSWPSTAILFWAILGFLARYEENLYPPFGYRNTQKKVRTKRSRAGASPLLSSSPGVGLRERETRADG